MCYFQLFYYIFGPRGSGGYDYKSGGVFCRFLIVLISFMAVNVVISAAWRCPAAAGRAREENNVKKRKIGVCLMVFAGLSLGVLYGYFIRGVTNKLDD